MIPINKDLTNIPLSLRVDEESVKTDPTKTTHEHRKSVIANGVYPDADHSGKFDDRYKYKDVKDALKNLYGDKCAYCETYDPTIHVEHYRPKRGGYYWLAFSWDNLILCCSRCNISKGNKFPIEAANRVIYGGTDEEYSNINTSSAIYDNKEHPLLLNPERLCSQIYSVLAFDQKGQILENEPHITQTIKDCDLNRVDLCSKRAKIWNDLKDDLADCVAEAQGDQGLLEKFVNITLKRFAKYANDKSEMYLAFRQYVIKSGWISDYIKELTLKKV